LTWELKRKGGMGKNEPMKWRSSVVPADVAEIRRIVMATNAFSGEEIDIAAELAEERIAKGRVSGYEFILATQNGKLAGYTCYGKTPGSERAYDLYWLAVDPDRQRSGLGHQILERTEAAIRKAGGAFMIAETSSTGAYDKARAFYERVGFEKLVEIKDFYRPGDNKVIYRKSCPPQS